MSKGLENIFKYASFFVSGLISGMVLGLVSAPKPGKELREDIASKSHEWKNITKDKLDHLQEEAKVQTVKVANAIKNTADKISSKLSDLAKNNDRTLVR